MTCDAITALNDMNAMFLGAWKSNAGKIVDYVPEVRWFGTEQLGKPDKDKFWVRHSTQGVSTPQTAMGGCEDELKRRYTAYGLLFVQLFCPKHISNSLFLGRRLAQVAQSAYRGKQSPNGVWFRNVRVQELTPEEPWYRLNVVAEYEYDEIA